MVRLLGLTGPIACGKSTVSERLAAGGWPVVDADKIAHELLSDRAGRVHRRVVAEFGQEVLTDGAIDREKLGKIVFGDPRKRRKLDQATHMAILWAILQKTLAFMLQGHGTIVLDVPLLLKFPLLRRLCLSAVLVVVLSPEVQLARLMSRNGLTQEEAEKKIASQLSVAEQRKLADMVIENNGTLEELDASVRAFQRAAPSGWPLSWTCGSLATAGGLGAAAGVQAGLSSTTGCLLGLLGAAAAGVCLVEMALKDGAEAAYQKLRRFELKGTQVSVDWSTMAKTEMGMCKKRQEPEKPEDVPTRSFKEHATEESLGFRLHQVVSILNLKGAAQFNGCTATVVGFRPERVEVEVEVGGAKKTLALKPENLLDATSQTGSAEKAEEPPEPPPTESRRRRKWEENSGGFVVTHEARKPEPEKEEKLPMSMAELEQLSMKELKQVLKEHGVDTTGCLEKPEFLQKAKERARTA